MLCVNTCNSRLNVEIIQYDYLVMMSIKNLILSYSVMSVFLSMSCS